VHAIHTIPPSVIVIDEESMIVTMLIVALDAAGYCPVVGPMNGSAYTFIQAHQPAAVLLDVEMPNLDGIDLAKALQADPAMTNLPVFLMTGAPWKLEQRFPDYAQNGVHLLTKPFMINQLLTMLQEKISTPPALH